MTGESFPSKARVFLQPHLRLVVIIALSVFICEALVMCVISILSFSSAFFEALFDATLLIILLSPILYFFTFRPLVVQHIRERKLAEEALRASHNGLKSRVEA